MNDCRWKSLENDCYICRCGYSYEFMSIIDDTVCEKCEDFYSVIDSENERKVDDSTGEIL